MSTDALLKAEMVPRLIPLGLKKRTSFVFTIEIGPDIVGWLGLNHASRAGLPGEVRLNPVVGVRFQQVERIVAECSGMAFHAYRPPTVCMPLCDVPPISPLDWVLAPGRSAQPAADLAAAVATRGLPFMRSITDLPTLIQHIDARHGFDHMLVYRRPVAQLLAGDPHGARATLDAAVQATSALTDPATTAFRAFAATFRQRLPAPAAAATER